MAWSSFYNEVCEFVDAHDASTSFQVFVFGEDGLVADVGEFCLTGHDAWALEEVGDGIADWVSERSGRFEIRALVEDHDGAATVATRELGS